MQKSGFMGRRSNKRKQFNTFWFELKNSVLTYYESSRDQYLPIGSIALKTVIAVEDSKSRPRCFRLVTPKKSLQLQCDTRQSQIDWRKSVEAAVFRARNKGDHVRVVLPCSSITDVKLLQAANFADTIMVAVEDEDEDGTISTDEYYFSYFLDARQLFKDMKDMHSLLTQDTSAETSEDVVKTTFKHKINFDDDLLPHEVFSDDERPAGWSIADWLPGFRGSLRPASRPKRTVTETVNLASSKIPHLLKIFPLLPADYITLGTFTCYLVSGVLPKLGKLDVVTSSEGSYLLYRSKLVGVKSKAFLPCSDIIVARKQSGMFRFGLSVFMQDDSELWFEFHSGDQRNKCLDLITPLIKPEDEIEENLFSDSDDDDIVSPVLSPLVPENQQSIHSFSHYRQASYILDQIHRADKNFATAELSEEQLFQLPPLLTSGAGKRDEHLVIRPPQPMVFTCLTIGTRGDVQPFIALCKGLMKYGHKCRIATHSEYKDWVESHGIEFRVLSGNPADIMRLCVDNGMFSISFIREGVLKLLRHILTV